MGVIRDECFDIVYYDNNDDPESEGLNPVYVPERYMCSYNHIYYGGESL